MPYLDIPEPDWDALPGGSEQEAKWIAERDRKFSLMMEEVRNVIPLAEELERRSTLLKCSPGILRSHPAAVDWYLCAAGYALNALQYIRQSPKNFGLHRRVLTVRSRLLAQKPIPTAELACFSAWVNSELDVLYKDLAPEVRTVSGIVFGMLGARAVGKVQNLAGKDGVDLLRRLLVESATRLGIEVTAELDDGAIRIGVKPTVLYKAQRIRLGKNIVCDFTAGGGHADIRITDQGLLVAVGEVKARKDVSNIWESWMPQVADHMRTWTGETPDALRLFFGTLITEEMLGGFSANMTRRTGLVTMYKNGTLSSAYNLSKIASGNPTAQKEFGYLMEQLRSRVRQ